MVTVSFKENLFKLSQALIEIEKMWEKKSIYDFDHNEYQILENKKTEYEVNLKEIVKNLNYENINYFLKKEIISIRLLSFCKVEIVSLKILK